MSKAPKISFVVASRNDNHGGDMLKRMRIFTNGLYHQTRKYNLTAELIFVEWNPDPKKPLLHEVLPKPSTDDCLIVRYVVVDEKIHSTYKVGRNMPLFQMIAKNVGIRRAKGNFVVCTNVDLLFSDSLMRFLATSRLDENTFYRANRCDIPKGIDENQSVENMLAFAKSNVLQRLGKNHHYPELEDTTSWMFRVPLGGRLMAIPKQIKRWRGKQTVDDKIAILDTDACGDFTMMSKQGWEKVKGYYELDAYSIHIDSLALICAMACGMQQKILDDEMVTYHISHESGWELADPIKKLYNDLERPMVDWSSVRSLAQKMLQDKKLTQVNDEDWGYATHKFKEYILEARKETIELN